MAKVFLLVRCDAQVPSSIRVDAGEVGGHQFLGGFVQFYGNLVDFLDHSILPTIRG